MTTSTEVEHANGSMSSVKAMRKHSRSWRNWTTVIISGTFSIALFAAAINYLMNVERLHKETATLLASDTENITSVHTRENNFKNDKSSDIENISTPKRLIAPTVELGIDIINSHVIEESNDWPLSDTSAHYANFTPGLGSKTGTLLIYGHNTWSALRRAKNLSIGDRVFLVDDQGVSWELKLTEIEIVDPKNVMFIYEDTDFRVVVLTCDGWNDQYRQLMFFQPV